MLQFTLPDGRQLAPGTPFTLSEIQHPANWLELATDSDLSERGITKQSTPTPLTPDDVVAERERRLALGFSFDFGDGRGVHRFSTTAQDMKGWDEVTTTAQAAINVGAPNTAIAIVTNTGPVSVTALEWQQVLIQAAGFRQPIWQKSFQLQAMSPIPADYASDARWS